MYKFSREFGRILAAIFFTCPDESARVVIAENLFEELGEGDAKRTHAELFRHFTRALEINDRELDHSKTEPETAQLIDTYLGLANKYGYLGALGAVCFASEGIVSDLYTQLQRGISGAATLPKESMVFFEVHVVTDTGHAAALASVIEPRLTPESALVLREAVREAMDARVKFFDGVTRRARIEGPSFEAYIRTQDLLCSQDISRSQDLRRTQI